MVRDFTIRSMKMDAIVAEREEGSAPAGVRGKGISPVRKVNSYGFELLWQMMQDGLYNKISAEIMSSVITSLIALLATEECAGLKATLIERCIDNLSDHSSVPQSLDLVEKIFRTYPQRERRWYTRDKSSLWSIIEGLENKHRLLDKFLGDLQKCHKAFKASSVDRLEHAHIGQSQYSYRQHVESRLNFLNFLLNSSSLELSEDRGHINVSSFARQ